MYLMFCICSKTKVVSFKCCYVKKSVEVIIFCMNNNKKLVSNNCYLLFSQVFKNILFFKIRRGKLSLFHDFNFYFELIFLNNTLTN